jgi:hypothetical protein
MEFFRSQGEGGREQRWIDTNLPTCPLCREPGLWKTATGGDQLAERRWYFECQSCRAVLSVIAEGARVGAEPSTPVPGSKPMGAEPVDEANEALQVDVRVDSVHRKQDEDFVGEEFSLDELQEWASES